MKAPLKSLGNLRKLDERRARLGMSKADVAKRSGVSLPTVNRILAGKEHEPSIVKVHAIAMALGVEVRLGSKGEIQIDEPQTPEQFQYEQARAKAGKMIRMVQGTMALEAQAVDDESYRRLVDRATYRLLESKRKLWGQ